MEIELIEVWSLELLQVNQSMHHFRQTQISHLQNLVREEQQSKVSGSSKGVG